MRRQKARAIRENNGLKGEAQSKEEVKYIIVYEVGMLAKR